MTPYDAAQRAKKSLLAREAALARKVILLYQGSEQRAKERITALTREIQQAEILTAEGKIYRRARVQDLLAQIESELESMGATTGQLVNVAQETNIEAALSDSTTMARALRVESMFNVLPTESLLQLAGQMADGTPLDTVFRRIGTEQAGKIQQILFDGVAQGRAPKLIGRELSREVEGLTRERAVLIARTESIRSYRESGIRNYGYNDRLITGWRWMATKSARTCPACLALDGTEHPVTEQFGSHPACRCNPVPVLIVGNPAWGPTGAEWFATQPESVQRAILGPATFKLYQSRAIGLTDLVDRHPTVWGPSANVRSVKALLRQQIITADQAQAVLLRRRAA